MPGFLQNALTGMILCNPPSLYNRPPRLTLYELWVPKDSKSKIPEKNGQRTYRTIRKNKKYKFKSAININIIPHEKKG